MSFRLRTPGTVGAADEPSRGIPYKWMALSNTTLGVLMATINATSILIAMPVIFRGIKVNPLDPANFGYLLWLLMGYMLVTAVLVVTVGRLGDMFGRVRTYNLGFLVFTLAAVALSLTPGTGSTGAIELIALRAVQAIGGAMLMANSAAILTDAFPPTQLGFALGINMIAGLAGSFLGILAGGLLAQVDWRWIFLVNVPIGLFGTVWAYFQLREVGVRSRGRIDWVGNLTFALGLGLIVTGFTYGIKPYGGSPMGWSNPFVYGSIIAGIAILAAFAFVEQRVPNPMFNFDLFRIRAFLFGNLASMLAAISRGGLQFMLIIWLQGIWLPLHGYRFTDTPLWAGIYLLPLTFGFMVAGPVSGFLSDRFGARPFATAGMVAAAATFGLLLLLPVDFPYAAFGAVIFLNGVAMGLFTSPNTASIMNSVPARDRGAASGMRVTFTNVGMPLSIGLFFTLMILGLNASVPSTMFHGLTASGVPAPVAQRLSGLPPVGYLFASFLGYNPLKTLLGPVLGQLPPADAARLTSHAFFPSLIATPFQHGLALVLSFAVVASLVSAAASILQGGRYIHVERMADAVG